MGWHTALSVPSVRSSDKLWSSVHMLYVGEQELLQYVPISLTLHGSKCAVM